MDSDTKLADLPPSYEDTIRQGLDHASAGQKSLSPTELLLEGEFIRDESSPTLLYQLSRDVTTLPKTPPKNSSIIFNRVDYELNVPEKLGAEATTNIQQQPQPQHHHLFYLAHPADAQYHTDIPGYYITSVDSKQTLGNMHLETSKSRLQKTEFTALLSAGRTCIDKPLFNEPGKSSVLFSARPTGWTGSRYTWTNSDGYQVAMEDGPRPGKDSPKCCKLSITAQMKQEERDALVGLWALRLWFETAESRQAKREALERMSPPSMYQDSTMGKRTGALGALGGAGGGC